MTDTFDLAAMIADREAGTPGPWMRENTLVYALMHHGWRRGIEEFRNRFSTRVDHDQQSKNVEEAEANARRIARVPEMEAEILRLRAELATTRRHALQDAADACRARADMITAFDMDCCEGTANNCASDIEALMEEPSHD